MKIFWGVFIDLDVFQRRNYFLVCSVFNTLLHILIGSNICTSAMQEAWCMFALNLFQSFMDCVTKSVLIRESRHDPVNGFKDL